MKTTLKLTFLVLVTIIGISCNTKSQSKSDNKSGSISVIAPSEFKEKSKNQVIIDIRTPQEFSQGHIEGAININYYDRTFLDQVSKYEKNTTLFLYCRSGNRTSSASSKLSKLGFKNIYDLDGGIMNWSQNNLPIIKE